MGQIVVRRNELVATLLDEIGEALGAIESEDFDRAISILKSRNQSKYSNSEEPYLFANPSMGQEFSEEMLGILNAWLPWAKSLDSVSLETEQILNLGVLAADYGLILDNSD